VAVLLTVSFLLSVIVIDTANEIGGDGNVPHASIGRARRMQVKNVAQQHAVMVEAIQNHTPDVVIVDEVCFSPPPPVCLLYSFPLISPDWHP
jgi:stage III sporulation protein SpoIIIAA